MGAYVEIGGAIPELVPLERQRTTVGRADGSDIRLTDPTVSELHAVIESYGEWYAIRDMGSSNGTFVNSEQVVAERRLRSGDEIHVGAARLVFRAEQQNGVLRTEEAEGPPRLTQRERDVLLALCRPILGRAAFAQPATIRELAGELVVSEAAIKFHLANLYDKFDLRDPSKSRRVELANEAVRRRAVSIADLRRSPS